MQRESEPSRLPVRRRPAQGVDYTWDDYPLLHVAVCTKARRPWLAQPRVHAALLTVWKSATAWRVGRYVLMPDHLHMIATPGEADISLERWVAYWKSLYSRKHASPEEVWQLNCWDRRLRSDESYDEKWEYIRNNPVRAGLVSRAEDWPYAGEIWQLEF